MPLRQRLLNKQKPVPRDIKYSRFLEGPSGGQVPKWQGLSKPDEGLWRRGPFRGANPFYTCPPSLPETEVQTKGHSPVKRTTTWKEKVHGLRASWGTYSWTEPVRGQRVGKWWEVGRENIVGGGWQEGKHGCGEPPAIRWEIGQDDQAGLKEWGNTGARK